MFYFCSMKKEEIELQRTADGTHTLYLPEIDEHYHSTNGALQEALHVYINAGFNCSSKSEISLFEVGFGTGLNAFLTLLEAENRGVKVKYVAIEQYPLPKELAQTLNYASIISPENQHLFDLFHECEWDKEVEITPYFILKKVNADLINYTFDQFFDVIYYDAFAPEKQPEMWQSFLFDKLFLNANEEATLTTYCAKGVVRRALQNAGFVVERLPGPIGKREMLRARVI